MYIVKKSKKFRRGYKRIKGDIKFNKKKFEFILIDLVKNKPLDPIHRNHKLTGEHTGCFECHIESDILLIYEIDRINKIIYLGRIGSHSELFG